VTGDFSYKVEAKEVCQGIIKAMLVFGLETIQEEDGANEVLSLLFK